MITELIIKVRYKSETRLDAHIAPLMHGVLMEQVRRDYGEELHKNQLKPFSQMVFQMEEDSFSWRICTLTDEAKKEIIDHILLKEEFYLEQKKVLLSVEEKTIRTIDDEKLVEQYYFQEQPRKVTASFRTPVSFKSGGRYVIMPTPRLIFQSLCSKYDNASADTEVSGEEVLDHIEQCVYITRYQLRSTVFAVGKAKIPSFMGKLTFTIEGPRQLVNLIHLLLAFGEYAGVGIKTSLGMGAMHIERS